MLTALASSLTFCRTVTPSANDVTYVRGFELRRAQSERVLTSGTKIAALELHPLSRVVASQSRPTLLALVSRRLLLANKAPFGRTSGI